MFEPEEDTQSIESTPPQPPPPPPPVGPKVPSKEVYPPGHEIC